MVCADIVGGELELVHLKWSQHVYHVYQYKKRTSSHVTWSSGGFRHIFELSIRNIEKNPINISYSDVLLGIMNEKEVITKYTLDLVVYIDKTLVHMIENEGLQSAPFAVSILALI